MNGKKVLKARPKIYIADAAIRNAVLTDDSIMADPTETGKVVETAVYKHIAAFYYQFATSVGYFRGGRKNKETDMRQKLIAYSGICAFYICSATLKNTGVAARISHRNKAHADSN